MLRRLAAESAIYGIAGVLQRLGALLLLPLCAHLFTPADFGALGLALTTATLLSILITFGLDNSAHRWFWDSDDIKDRQRTIASWFWFHLGGASAAGLLLALAAPKIAGPLIGDDSAWPMLAILGLGLPFTAIVTVCGNWLRMQRRPWAFLILASASMTVQISAAFVLVVGLQQGTYGYCVAQVLATAAPAMVALWLLKGWISPRAFSRHLLREMLRFALPLVPASLALWATVSFNRYALGAFGSIADVGLFQLGSTIGMAMTLLTGAFQQAWGPFALSIHQQVGHERVYSHVFLLVTMVGCLLSCGLMAIAPDVVWLLAAPDYAGAAVVVGPIALTCALTAITYVLAIAPTIAKDTRPVAWSIVIGGVVTVVANLLMVPGLGLDGAALAGVLGQLVAVIWLQIAAQRLIKFPYPWIVAVLFLGLSALTMMATRWHHSEPGFTGTMMRLAFCLPLLLGSIWIWLHHPSGMIALRHLSKRDSARSESDTTHQ